MKTTEQNIVLLKAGIHKYGNEIIFDLLDYCINPENEDCGDDQCDYEPCIMYMAFQKMIKYGDYSQTSNPKSVKEFLQVTEPTFIQKVKNYITKLFK